MHDEPMVRYLGARAESPTFHPTLYKAEEARAELAKAEAGPEAKRRSRISVLLANRACDQTLTVTPILWAMLGVLPLDEIQVPHRHQSVALDLIIDCKPGCFTLVDKELDDSSRIIDLQRVDWKPASAFVTPPGFWHAHYNESGARRTCCRSRKRGCRPTCGRWISGSATRTERPRRPLPAPGGASSGTGPSRGGRHLPPGSAAGGGALIRAPATAFRTAGSACGPTRCASRPACIRCLPFRSR